MRQALAAILVLVVAAPFPAIAGNLTRFQGGTTEEVARLTGPGFTGYVNISIPADSIIMGAAIDVSNLVPGAANPDCPGPVQVYLDDTLLWGFSGPGYGALGKQDAFVLESKAEKFGFGEDGGSGNCSIRLMKEALIKNATMEVKCNGAGWVSQAAMIEPQNWNHDLFSYSVADAGDVNRDGCGDFVIGAPLNDSNGQRSGRAYVYYGGKVVNRTADVALTGESALNYLGTAVSGAGDVNGDGYDDVIVGATRCADYLPCDDVSRAYIYYGGAAMDSAPDVLLGGEPNSSFGISVSGAGDVNGDGFGDVVVGTYNTSQNGIGRAFVYLGGPSMDNVPDAVLTGSGMLDGFGHAVSGAGDVNNDSYDDVIVGAYTGTMRPGRNPLGFGACLFLGGKVMDGGADVLFGGDVPTDIFGVSVSGADDVNGDGYDDLVIGAPGVDSKRGAAFVYCGGASVDNRCDFVFNGSDANDLFGASVSDAGDVNADGLADVVITAPGYSRPENIDLGAAYMFYGGEDMQWNRDMFYQGSHQDDGNFFTGSSAGDVNGDGHDEVFLGSPVDDECPLFVHGGDGLDRPDISVGGKGVWTKTGYFNGAETTLPFPMILQAYFDTRPPSVKDEHGNVYVDVPVDLSAKGGGRMMLGNLNITYVYKASIANFTEPLKEYVAAHRFGVGPDGNVTVPIKVVSATPGAVKLLNLKISLDEAPALRAAISDLRLAEDTRQSMMADLRIHFRDDYDSLENLNFRAIAITNGSIVNISIQNGHFLSVDSLTSPSSENWTGEARAVVECSDTGNLTRRSNEFAITVYNVNDAPVIVSPAPSPAYAGEGYGLRVMAVDGDGDSISYGLAKNPPGMTMDPATGLIGWPSPIKGTYEITVQVSDGQANSSQKYILAVLNRPIWISNTTIPEAMTGVRYTYKIPAVSETGKELVYRLVGAVEGMTIDAYSGNLTWTPTHAGNYSVSINISDGDDFRCYDFTIHVVRGNRAPKFVSDPVLTAVRGLKYIYQARATDEDDEALGFSLGSAIANMTVNASSGRVDWVPDATGLFNVSIRVSDGRGGEDIQRFTLHVGEYVPSSVTITEPDKGQTVKGKIAISGTVTRGTLDVEYVQLRIDSGDWMNARGNTSWSAVLDTTKLTDGGHRISVRAFDGNAFSEVEARDLNVRNADTDHTLLAGAAAVAAVGIVAGLIVLRGRRKAPAS